MKERFEKRNLFGKIKIGMDNGKTWFADKAEIVNHMLRITKTYAQEGYRLTLRQLYYQLVGGDFIPNNDKVYKKIGSIKDDACYAGLLDWDYIEDRGRVPIMPYTVDGVKDALSDTVDSYFLQRQLGQKRVVELWTEKDAISNILKKVTMEYCVRLCVNKGYTSSSAIYSAYRRFANILNDGKTITLLYFGDHDPSGLDMIRDIRERLIMMLYNGNQLDTDAVEAWTTTFLNGEETYTDACWNYFDDEDCQSTYESDGESYFDSKKAFIKHHFEVKQIGLTKAQIREYNLPPNPAKITDPRAKGYIALHGNTSWEVDALKPNVLAQIVRTNIVDNIDMELYNKMIEREKSERAVIREFAESYEPETDDTDSE